jgi:Icc-related predicted phosphoesterase
MKITCLGCCHGYYPEINPCDILIVTGDLTAHDKLSEYKQFDLWLKRQSAKHKIVIAGNHDMLMERSGYTIENGRYLCNELLEIEGLKIWGSPNSLWFPGINPHCTAFTGNENDLEKLYKKIPEGIDILVTHTPPHLVLDEIKAIKFTGRDAFENVGSESLLHHMERVVPKYHIFSHIHENGGEMIGYNHGRHDTLCANVSIMNEFYRPVNEPITIEV